jgi:polyvinyl alcohol dehydrogenase (cytochrome)
MKKTFGLLGAIAIAALGFTLPAHAQQMTGQQVYEARCKGCHDGGNPRAPTRADLAQRPAADIVAALTSGIMQPMAAGLSDADKQAVAAFLTAAGPTPPPQAAAAPPARGGNPVEQIQVAIPNSQVGTDPKCATNPPIQARAAGDWPSMGLDDAAHRFQKTPGLTPDQVKRLKVKWSFAMTGGGQPTVVGDWLFVTNRSGKFYALDAKTGCVHWSVTDLVSRTTPLILKSPVSPSGWLAVAGQTDRIVRAFDAQTGKEIWRSAKLEDHTSSVLTGAIVATADRLLVPISSIEEATSMQPTYTCCTFRGSLAALDLKTGKTLWKTPTISEPMQTIPVRDGGKALKGPAGAAVWAAPSLDRKRGLAYIVTGDSYTDVDTKGADAVMAIDVATGKIRWQHQVTEKDNFVMGCGPTSKTGNCPTPLGPDFDFGSTPILMALKGGKSVLVAGQKSGIVYGMNPDTGALLWKNQIGVGSALGGVEWGMAADDAKVYVPISDLGGLFSEFRGPATGAAAQAGPMPVTAKPGLYALDPATGKVVWATPAPKAPCVYASDRGRPSRCARAQSAAPAVIPGLIFEGGLDGWFRAYDATNGQIVWEDSTTSRTYDTLNGIKGQPGGGIDGLPITVAGGMVYLVSGNNGAARVGSNGVNVLLAYSVDGK